MWLVNLPDRSCDKIKKYSESDSDSAAGRYASAKAHYEANELKAAERTLLEVLRSDPAMGDAYHLLSVVQLTLGSVSRALLTIDRWLSVEPTNPEAWSRSAALYLSLGRVGMACDAFAQAATLEPGEVRHWIGLATSALSAQNWTEAVRSRDYLLKRFDSEGSAHLIDGHVHKFGGDLAAAVESYKKALDLEPTLSSAIYNLVEVETPGLEDPFTKEIERLNQQADLKDSDKLNLEFALARIFDKAGQFGKAFDHYECANRATLRVMNSRGSYYRCESMEESVSQTLQNYADSAFRHPLADLPIELNLVFIVGLPRSGTTLLEQVLGSHPEVSPGGELLTAYECLRMYLTRRAELELGDKIDSSAPEHAEILEEVRELYLDSLPDDAMDGTLTINKLPGNFEILGFIRLLFPNAIVIHSRRDLRATCWSLYSSNFGMHEPYYNSLDHLAHYCRMYLRLMQHWRTVLDPPMIEISYEDLVTEPESAIRRLLSDIGLPWDARCVDFHQYSRPVLTASHSQVRQPLYKASLDKWRSYEPYLPELSCLNVESNDGHERRNS